MSKKYNADDIKQLEGLEAVRIRPGMYIGDTSTRGLHHCIEEVVDNSVDEALMGECDNIQIVLHTTGSVSITDNGRGIPIDMHESGKSALEVVMTQLHAGGKFDSKTYQASAGLHGVGISVVNALSSKLTAEVRRNGKIYRQKYRRGEPVTKVKAVGKTTKKDTGTKITFTPDDEIFTTTEYKFDKITDRMRELAFLNAGLTIIITDEHDDREETFMFKGGIRTFVSHLNRAEEKLHDVIYIKGKKDNISFQAAFQFNTGYGTNVVSFVNSVNTTEGGTHLSGFMNSFSRAIINFAKTKRGTTKVNVTQKDVLEGLTAVISVSVVDPIFEGQTKTKLGNRNVQRIVASIVKNYMEKVITRDTKVVSILADKAANAAEAREAAKKARNLMRNKKDAKLRASMAKLAHCTSKKREEIEIFLAEGDSAGGSAKQGRDRSIQAVLPLRGKVLNVEKAKMVKILANEEIKTIIATLGGGLGPDFELKDTRYGKVILLCDADVDGSHIQTLLLTFFFRQMTSLIKNGDVYLAKPPLFKITKGKKKYYCEDEIDLEKKITEIGIEKEKLHIQRYKGLGEMNASELWETTLDPDNRTLVRVTLEDAAEATIMFSTLMGSAVPPRKKFIMENSGTVEIDV